MNSVHRSTFVKPYECLAKKGFKNSSNSSVSNSELKSLSSGYLPMVFVLKYVYTYVQ